MIDLRHRLDHGRKAPNSDNSGNRCCFFQCCLSHRDPCESELKMADRIQYHGLMKNLPQSTRTYNREFPSAHARTRLSLLTSSIVLYTTVARSDSNDRCKCACACVCLSVSVFPLPMVNVWDSVSMNLSL